MPDCKKIDCCPPGIYGYQPEFTATASYTALCPVGEVGDPVVVTKTATSQISYQDAYDTALVQAQAEAEEEIVCESPPECLLTAEVGTYSEDQVLGVKILFNGSEDTYAVSASNINFPYVPTEEAFGSPPAIFGFIRDSIEVPYFPAGNYSFDFVISYDSENYCGTVSWVLSNDGSNIIIEDIIVTCSECTPSLQIQMVYELIQQSGSEVSAGQNLVNQTITETQEFDTIGMSVQLVNNSSPSENFVYEGRITMTLTAIGPWQCAFNLPSLYPNTTYVLNADGNGAYYMGATIDDEATISSSIISGASGQDEASSTATDSFVINNDTKEVTFVLLCTIEDARMFFVDEAYAFVNLFCTKL